jgi:hypothetical protein
VFQNDTLAGFARVTEFSRDAQPAAIASAADRAQRVAA